MPEERTAQLIGGPDHGNLVSATIDEIRIRFTTEWDLDGDGFNSRSVVYGRYIWDPEGYCFRWKLGVGP